MFEKSYTGDEWHHGTIFHHNSSVAIHHILAIFSLKQLVERYHAIISF